MRKLYFICAIIFFGLAASAAYASSSASFSIPVEVIDSGAAFSSSSLYQLIGKAREREISDSTSAGFIMQTGFIKCAYFSEEAVLAPIVTSITPSSAPSTGPVNITNLGGANFQPGAVVKLSKIGQSDIIATNVVTVSSSKITCTFDLTGAASGAWNVTVINPDTLSGTLPAAFTVNATGPTVTSVFP
jgi:hypothetical protein